MAESIKSNGLYHAICLRWQETFSFEPGDGSISPGAGRWILVSGERRLRAITDIYALGGSFRHDGEAVPANHIPYTTLGELDELAREEAELEENIRRTDLSWQERASATARIASLRARQAVAAGLPPPPTAKIAIEVRGSSEGVHQETTRRELIVAKHLGDAEVSAAKSVDEAFKILKRKEETQRRVVLSTEVGKTYSAGTAHRLLNEDSLLWMAAATAEQFDVICTDPIYGIGADEFGDSGGKAAGAHFYKDDYETWQRHVACLAIQGFRIAKKQAHLYAFCDITRFEEFKGYLTAAGWNCFRTPIVWHKPNGSRIPWIVPYAHGPQRKFEIILYANKGKKPVTRIYSDLVSYPADENLGHQAQKPVALFEDLLNRSVSAGDSVLDPFAGSCPILPASTLLKVKATAIELDAAAYGIGVDRLKKLTEAPELEGM